MNHIPLFVYGTLRRGESNHRLLDGATYGGESQLLGNWRLANLGWFPGIVPAETPARICGERYLISEATLKIVDRLEGHPHMYTRFWLRLVDGSCAWAYVYQARAETALPLIASGDWINRSEA